MPKISVTRVRQIIKEELRAARLREATAPDHKATASVVSAASKLLAALESFTKSTESLPAVAGATTVHVDSLQKALAHMVEAPTSYARLPAEPKIVRLRAQQTDGGTTGKSL